MPMTTIIMPNELDELNRKNEFLAYKGTSNKNILFLGSCRNSPIMYYLSLLRPELNIFCIYVPFWSTEWNSNPDRTFPKEKISAIIPNTEFIVTESIKNNSILNTSDCPNNFFSEFDAKLKEIKLPNYIISMYFYDIANRNFEGDFTLSEATKIEYKEIYEKSRERMSHSIKNAGLDAVNDFFDEHFNKIKMYSTINHPTTIISMLTFKLIAERLGVNPSLEFMKEVSKKHFLSGNSTPVTEMDMDIYNFKFNTKVFGNEILKTKGMYYSPGSEEDIPEDHVKIIMSDRYSLKEK